VLSAMVSGAANEGTHHESAPRLVRAESSLDSIELARRPLCYTKLARDCKQH